MKMLNSHKIIDLFPSHTNSSLNQAWQTTQLSLLLLPFSPLLGGLTLFINSLVLWKKYGSQFLKSWINRTFLILGVMMIITTLLSDRKDVAAIGLFNFLPFFIVFTAQCFLIRDTKQLRELALMLVIPSLPIAFLAIAQIIWGWAFDWKLLSFGGSSGLIFDWVLTSAKAQCDRSTSLFYIATTLGSYLVITFTLSLGLWVESFNQPKLIIKRNWIGWIVWIFRSRWGLGCLFALNAIALCLTQSRSAWGIALSEIVILGVWTGYYWISGITSTAIAVIAAAVYAPPPWNSVLQRISPGFVLCRIDDYQDFPEITHRSGVFKFTIKMIQQRPITGWGLRNFSPIFEAATTYYMGHPHNLFLMLAAETGIPATIVFCGLVTFIMVSGIKKVRTLRLGEEKRSLLLIIFAFLSCVAFSLFDVTLFDIRINTIGWMLLAAICGFSQHTGNSAVDRISLDHPEDNLA